VDIHDQAFLYSLAPDKLRDHLVEEIDVYREIVKKSGISLD